MGANAECCTCPPTCETDDSGDACLIASCGWCLHGCPAIDDDKCCRGPVLIVSSSTSANPTP